MQHVDLPRGNEMGECIAIEQAAALVDAGNSTPIHWLQALELAAQLAVDVIDDTRPRGAWILVGWNDLVADRGESAGFIKRKKSPRSSVGGASHARSGRRDESGLDRKSTRLNSSHLG